MAIETTVDEDEICLPEGLRIIQMPSKSHRGVAEGSMGELYYCIRGPEGYNYTLAD